ncbi:4-carboxymuconolactone decarboxylase /3-oxoadipate enol-lactonase [Rudaeicoccus suwonensis]|uniref:4-carboxymuconolactone decarboxylase /3-oxoadipate enol-lactonase n=2 Tax=Rudaeicoccus suwonensis TaxID=657409 RepID=A0A561E6X1_9MICO|nr:4-carboxymuconolactone decarboxylase /3-oxoadipate enol-lactonase [Rudaeicoccus suwonensis]
MTETIRLTQLAASPAADAPILLVGPSIGTAVTTLWSECAAQLADTFQVVGWDLPGHGASPASAGAFTMAELAEAVAAAYVHSFGDEKAWYAGDSIGGAVGLQLALDRPALLHGLVTVCSAARFGDRDSWRTRADLVHRAGTSALISQSAGRWFTPDFVSRRSDVVSTMLHHLAEVDDGSYAHACGALADFDVRGRLGAITLPVLAIGGEEDVATPPAKAGEIAWGVKDGRVRVLPGVAHLAVIEAPSDVAALIGEFAAGGIAPDDLHTSGMAVRRQVLGPDHVDRAAAATTSFTSDFQALITRYAWGEIWNRPGLDRRSRSMITMTALIAGGHWDEFTMHVRAAVRNGLTANEIQEVILQSAIYCGVPAANHAFALANAALDIPPLDHRPLDTDEEATDADPAAD